tara:strand:- start:112 stop:243 length:132 start_codon:yes stop_codon:yes gene_type:complete
MSSNRKAEQGYAWNLHLAWYGVSNKNCNWPDPAASAAGTGIPL